MRSRERILNNLDQIYRESYDRAKDADQESRMVELDNAYMRDQLMLEILLDIRDLFAVAPGRHARKRRPRHLRSDLDRRLHGTNRHGSRRSRRTDRGDR
jgi:hypothetical protein